MVTQISGTATICITKSPPRIPYLLKLFINPSRERVIMADQIFRIPDDENFDLTIGLADRAGNPIGTLPNGTTCTFSGSDTTILTVTPDPANPANCTVATTGKLGSAQVSVAVVVNGNTMNGIMNVEVVAGDATTLSMTPTNIRPRDIAPTT
jgi:hypothetical protein